MITRIVLNCFLFVTSPDENPVITISQSVLEEEAARIGDPVAAFLTSDEFTSVAPDDITEV